MADASEDPTIFTAHSLPSDPRFWATVTNAYLGTRVYHDTLHVSGLYNGAQGDTHRAALPSPLNVQLEAPAGTGEQLTKTFTLDTNTGSHGLSCLPHPQSHCPSPMHNAPQKRRPRGAGVLDWQEPGVPCAAVASWTGNWGSESGSTSLPAPKGQQLCNHPGWP